jgi:hypothetical protein
VGWFERSVPPFLATHAGHAALLHLDADLYSSTKTVLDAFRDRIRPGTVIVFDEYYNYPGWKNHEWKAWQEFVNEKSYNYECVAFSETSVAVRISKVQSK